uniref:HNH nuclease domain-containing protein n=1 Tax=viral metagenome TaxID=1070528 RepID=A0A6M3LXQ1_9ZZZZ
MGRIKGYKKGTRKIKYICQYCGKEFFDFISGKRKFCDKKCFYKSGVTMIGKKHTEESKIKMRVNQSIASKNTQFKKGHEFIKGGEKGWFKKGQKPYNWAGGKRTPSQKIKDDVRYKRWRDAVFKRDDYTCMKCNERGCVLHPHHLESKSKNPDLAYTVSNGVTLCEKCHKIFHKKFGIYTNKRQYENFCSSIG